MRKKISFLVLSHQGKTIRQITISRNLVRLAVLLLIAALAVGGWMIADYQRLNQTRMASRLLESQLTAQQDEIQAQRKQIQTFATEINTLKDQIMAMNSFEKKIRIVANLGINDTESGLFGIGGYEPDDLKSELPLEQKHNSLLREMHTQTEQLAYAVHRQKISFESLFDGLEGKVNMLAATPSIRPVKGGWVTSRFGRRKSPFTGRKEFHKGFDIGAAKGTPIIATANGVVISAGRKGLLGKTLVIDHGYGLVTRYGHCKEFVKKKGEKVKRGDVVALVGNSGRSTGPHLHYEVHLNGVPVNPERYILN